MLPLVREERYGDAVRFLTEQEIPAAFLEAPALYTSDLVRGKDALVIHASDRSTVYAVQYDPFSGNAAPVIIKHLHGRTKEIVMRGDFGNAGDLLARRVRNRIYTARHAYDRGIMTSSPLFKGGVLREEDAWLAYAHAPAGVFMDDFLYARSTFADRFSLDDALEQVAVAMAALHGRAGEPGLLHRDLNTGNVLLLSDRRDRHIPSGCGVMLIDWEMSDYWIEPRVLSRKERCEDIYRLAGSSRNLHNKARLSKEEYVVLQERYDELAGF